MWFAGLLAIGSLGFWIAIVLCVIIGCIFMDMIENKDQNLLPISFFTIFAILLFFFFGDLKEGLSWVMAHKGKTAAYIGYYWCFGFVYSFVKWYYWTGSISEQYIEYKKNWLSLNAKRADPLVQAAIERITNWEDPEVPDIMKDLWKLYIQERLPAKINDFVMDRIHPSSYKTTIFSWIAWWPCSILWWALNYPIKRIVFRLIKLLGFVYNLITKINRRNVKKDFN